MADRPLSSLEVMGTEDSFGWLDEDEQAGLREEIEIVRRGSLNDPALPGAVSRIRIAVVAHIARERANGDP